MKLRAALLLFVVSCVCVAALAGDPADKEFVYVSNAGDSSLSGFSVDANNGELVSIPGSPFATGVGPGALARGPKGDYLYVAITQQLVGVPSNCIGVPGELIAYAIDANDGTLKQVQDVTLPGSCPADVVLDSTGGVAYVAMLSSDGSTNLIAAYTANHGQLTPVTGSPFTSAHPIAHLAIPRRLSILYASDPAENTGVLIFDRAPGTGALKFRSAVSTGVPLSSIVVGPFERFLLGITPLSAAQANLYEFTINNDGGNDNGDLAPTPGSPFPTPTDAAGLNVSPLGVKVAVSQSGGVAIHRRVGFEGALLLVAGSPFAAGQFPLAVTFDPSGKYVYVTNFQSANVSGFRVNRLIGALTPISGSPFATGSAPSNIVAVRPRDQ